MKPKTLSHWCYRIVQDSTKQNLYFGICEVYFDQDGNPKSCTEPISILGESLDEVKSELEKFQKAISQPVLNYPKDFS